MQLRLHGELPFVTASLTFRGSTTEISDVLVDTGAASTILNADCAAEAGVYLDRGDRLRVLRGVGGRELVFVRRVDRLTVGGVGLDGFEVEIGEMDYGFSIGGILGMDFLRSAGAIVDLRQLRLELRA